MPLLASIDKDILTLLLSETTSRSEQFIAELSSVLQLYVNVGTDIFTIAKCSQKVGAYFLGPRGGNPSTQGSHAHQAVPGTILPAWEIKGIVPTKLRHSGEGDGFGMGCVWDLGPWRVACLNVRGEVVWVGDWWRPLAGSHPFFIDRHCLPSLLDIWLMGGGWGGATWVALALPFAWSKEGASIRSTMEAPVEGEICCLRSL